MAMLDIAFRELGVFMDAEMLLGYRMLFWWNRDKVVLELDVLHGLVYRPWVLYDTCYRTTTL